MKKNNILYTRIEIPQPVKAVVFALLTLLGIWILTSAMQVKLHKITTLYTYDFKTHQLNIPTYVQMLYWIPYMLSLSAPMLAGAIIGKMLKGQYLKYTFLLGIIVGALPAFLILTYLLWPDKLFGKDMPHTFVNSFVYKHVLSQLFSIPKTTLLFIAGGFIGNKSKWSSRTIRIIVILFIALLCLFLLYKSALITSSKNEELPSLSKQEESNWQLYTHPILKFSIKHPSNIVIAKEFPEGVAFVRSNDKDRGYYGYVKPNLQILRRNGKAPTDALDSETPKCSSCTRPSYDTVTINNAIGLRTKTGFASAYNYYLIDKDNTGPVIRVSLSDNDGPDIDEFKKMIGTIEFTDDSASLPTPKKRWKWHVNKKSDIAFQYPEEFTPNIDGSIFAFGNKEFRVLIDKTTPKSVAPALEPASSQVIINNITWNIKDSYTYCDGGTCSPTGPTYYVYKDGQLVRIKYFQDEVWPVVEQVISSMVFNGSSIPSPTKAVQTLKIINNKYSFSIEYPSYIDESDSALRQPTLAREVYLHDLRIFVDDANSMTLQDYVNKAWTNNKETTKTITPYKKAGRIEETVISGTKGYQFTVTHSIAFRNIAETIEGTYILRFAKNGNFIYLLAYPQNNSEYQKIADTFTLLK